MQLSLIWSLWAFNGCFAKKTQEFWLDKDRNGKEINSRLDNTNNEFFPEIRRCVCQHHSYYSGWFLKYVFSKKKKIWHNSSRIFTEKRLNKIQMRQRVVVHSKKDGLHNTALKTFLVSPHCNENDTQFTYHVCILYSHIYLFIYSRSLIYNNII